MGKENVYYSYVEECSQRQGHLGESRVDMTLSHVGRRQEGRGERGTEYSSQDAQRHKESG